MNLRIAENIRRLRQENNLTQVQLADRLGVSYQAVSRWENETTYPDIELLPLIAAVFGVTVDYLLGGTAEDQRQSAEEPKAKVPVMDEAAIEALIAKQREAFEAQLREQLLGQLQANKEVKTEEKTEETAQV